MEVTMATAGAVRRVQTIVVGGGQAGLAVGHQLRRRGLPFLILDANARVGDAWRSRWDSLRLFTPARYAGLPGLRFPARGDSFPTKDQMADYLEAYARHFELPICHGVRVESLSREGGRFQLKAGERHYEADNVVVAMANYQRPRRPAFAAEFDRHIVQLHSHEYRDASQLRDGSVLVVGAGNSGADISLECSRTRETFLSGTETGHVPFPIESALGRFVLVRLVRFFGHHVLTLATPLGRRLRPKLLHTAAPLVRVRPVDLAAAGVERVARVAGVRDGRPLLADGRVLEPANVIWCTGYDPGFSWIRLPVFDERGDPRHERGVGREVPGLYFVGLHFLYSMTSATLLGVGRDAGHVAKAIASRVRELPAWDQPVSSQARQAAISSTSTYAVVMPPSSGSATLVGSPER
jgi:putative flavoprotein involved in K+ transport